MKKIDLSKARIQYQSSKLASTPVHVAFPDGINLAAAAQTAKETGGEYIELEGLASSPSLNDRGFIIAVSAWGDPVAFERFSGNPIVLFYHKQEFPIGQALTFEARPEGLWVKLRIRYNALLPTGEKIGDVIADGTLRALSIGIDKILDFEILETDDSITPVVTKLRLGEISVVSVGSDMGAICSVAEQFEKIFELASITDEEKGGFTMWKLLAKKFGMGDDATEEQVTAEYQRRETLGANAMIGLGLDPNNVTAEQLTSALAARDPKKLEELNKTNAKLNAQIRVNGAVSLHKIADNDEETKAWALSYAESDPVGFDKWLAIQKPVEPNTTTLTGAGSGKNLGGKPGENGGSIFITNEDREICLAFGQLTPEKMDELAETAPNVALGWVIGQNFPATAEDKKVLAARRRWDAACGIPAR